MHRVRAQDQVRGDLLIAQPARDEREDLAFSARQQRGSGLPGRVWETAKPLWLANVIDANAKPASVDTCTSCVRVRT